LPAELVYVPQDHHYANLLRPALPRHAIASRRERLRPGTPRIEPRDIVIGLEEDGSSHRPSRCTAGCESSKLHALNARTSRRRTCVYSP